MGNLTIVKIKISGSISCCGVEVYVAFFKTSPGARRAIITVPVRSNLAELLKGESLYKYGQGRYLVGHWDHFSQYCKTSVI